MTRQLRLAGLTSLLGASALFGCGGGNGGMDAGHDSGPRTDSGVIDTGVPVDMPSGVDLGHDMGGSTGMCPAGDCNLATGMGCSMAGQGCQFLSAAAGSTPSPMCVPSGTSTTACTMYTDCALGYYCDTTAHKCLHYCCAPAGTTVGCPTGTACNLDLVDMAGMSLGVSLCTSVDDGCNVLAQTGCTGTNSCFPGTGGGTVCVMAGTVAAGGTCTHTNDCMAGYSCLGPMAGPSMCEKLCNIDPDAGVSGCSGTQVCNPVTGFPAGVGYCH